LHAREVDIVKISGKDHEYMLREPYISELAAAVSKRLGNISDKPRG
jgi:hypothetical protein